MAKKDLQAKCDELGIKYQDNDTVEQLELMIAGKEAVAGGNESEKVAAMKAEIRDLKNQVKDAEGLIASQEEVINTLEKQLRTNSLTRGNDGARTVEIEGQTYIINGPSDPKKPTLKHQGRYYTADELAADPDLCKRILDKGTTLIYRA